jgi:hypothetical protein
MMKKMSGGNNMDFNTALQTILSFFSTYGIAIAVAGLIPLIFYGILTAKLAAKKGYRGYFFTGFFFTIIGLIYVVGLPLAKDCAVAVRRRVEE